jgi:hypothetical protein
MAQITGKDVADFPRIMRLMTECDTPASFARRTVP